MSAGAPHAPIRIDRKILPRPSSGGAAPARNAFAATRRESGRNCFRVDSRPPSSGSRPAGRHAHLTAFSCVSAAAGAASTGTPIRYGRHRRASGLSRLRFAPRQPDRDPVPVTASDTAHAGCGTLRRCHASRYLRGATPVAATRGCASRNLTGSGRPPAHGTPAGHSTRHRLVPGQVTATRRGSPVDTPWERAPALLRDAAQSSRRMDTPPARRPLLAGRRRRRPLPLLCDGAAARACPHIWTSSGRSTRTGRSRHSDALRQAAHHART